MSFAEFPIAVPAARRRKRCDHHWTLSHEESEWTVSGYHVRSTCTDCGAVGGVPRGTYDLYVRTHQLPTRKAAP